MISEPPDYTQVTCSSFFPHMVGLEQYTLRRQSLNSHLIISFWSKNLKSSKYHEVCNEAMGTNNMERRERQAASQAKMSRKGSTLSPLQNVTISQKKGKVKSYACRSQRKFCKIRRKISAFTAVCSYKVAPRGSPLSSAMNSFHHGCSSRKQIRHHHIRAGVTEA